MYIFTRQARLLPGRVRESSAWAVRLTERVNQVGELEFGLWSRVLSRGLGTLCWSTRVEHLGEMVATQDKLRADGGYDDLIDEGAAFLTPEVDDSVMAVAYGDPAPGHEVPCVSVTTARAAPGRLGEAIAVGIEMAREAERLFGSHVLFLTAATGPYGLVAWVAEHDSVAALQSAQQSFSSELVAAADRTSAAFQPGPQSERFVLRRLA